MMLHDPCVLGQNFIDGDTMWQRNSKFFIFNICWPNTWQLQNPLQANGPLLIPRPVTSEIFHNRTCWQQTPFRLETVDTTCFTVNYNEKPLWSKIPAAFCASCLLQTLYSRNLLQFYKQSYITSLLHQKSTNSKNKVPARCIQLK